MIKTSQRIRLSLLAFLLITLGMAVYEWIKTLFLPNLTLWESHVITIFLSGIIGAVAAYFLYGGLNLESTMDIGKIRTRIFAPIALAILALVAVSSLSNYIFVEKISETEHKEVLKKVKDLYNMEISEDSKSFTTMAYLISLNKEIQQSFKNKNREELLSLTNALYQELNEKYNVTHFYFHDTEKVCFLRVHKPESYGDAITRNTLKRAEEEGKPVSGIELGMFGTLTLRTVYPWYINGELDGYIELGMEVNEIVEEVKELFTLELYVIIQKEFLDKENWEKGLSMMGYKGEWERFTNFVILNDTLQELPAEVSHHFEESVTGEYIHAASEGNNLTYTTGHFPLVDDAGKMVGYLYFLEDEQDTHLIMTQMMIFQILLIITIGLLLSITLYIYVSRIERKLAQSQKELIEYQTSLEQRVEEEVEKLRKNEQILMQQSKLAAMGEMIGAISHQWRQPLNSLGLFVQGIEDAYEYDELNKEFIDETVEKSMAQINYMSSTIDDFRNFFKQSKEKVEFHLADAVKDVSSLTSAQLEGHYIELVFLHDEKKEELTLYGYLNEFKQVLLNLISNAKDAIVEKREKAGAKHDENGRIIIKISNQNGSIHLEIADNGGGVPEHLLDRVFEPYFSTKEEGKGSGIGLYMSKTIIEQNMSGKLYARNSHEGAVFTIEIDPHTFDATDISQKT